MLASFLINGWEGAVEHIQLRQIAHFTCAAPAYGPGVAERLGVISKVPGRRIAAFAGLG